MATTTSRLVEPPVSRRPADRIGEQRGQGTNPNGAKFRREERRELRYLLSIATAVVCSWVTYLIPRPLRYRIADLLGDLFFRISPTYRENVMDNLAHVLDEEATSEAVVQAAKQVFRVSSRNFADLLVVPRESGRQLVERVDVVRGSFGLLDEALEEGRGALILTGHIGAFDIVGQVLHEHGYKLTIVTGRTTARALFDAVTYLRRTRGMNLVEATPSGVRRAIQAVRRGECAVFVSDRDFFQNGRAVTLFGEETTLPPGIVRIALQTDAPIVPVIAERTPTGHGITVEPGFKIAKTADLDADLDAGMRQVAAVIERAIARTPDQWVMFQRVWPSAPADPVRVFPVGSPLESELLERVDAALPRRRQPPPPA